MDRDEKLLSGEFESSARWFGRSASNRMRTRTISAVFVLAITFASVVAAGPIYAAVTDNMFKTSNTNWDCSDGSAVEPEGLFCRTDNATLTVYLAGSLTSGSKSAIRASLDNSYTLTDLNVSYHSTATYGGSSETDIIYGQTESGFTGTTIGIAWCNDAVSSTVCDQHYVRFRYDSIVRALACHETGHAVGLTHGSNASPALSKSDTRLGCMVTPLVNSLAYLAQNNTDNINSTY